MKKIFFTVWVLIISLTGMTQDTLKVMHYNLLNYGNVTSYCTTSNNSFVVKEQYLKRILDYIKPDILEVNELGSNTFIHQRLLDSVLNHGGVNYYMKANYSNDAGSDIVVMMYYDGRKLALDKQYVLNTEVRDIVLYRLYYKDPNLSQTHDTAFVNCIGAHLKAGSSTSDVQMRATMTLNAMSWLNQHMGADNYLFMGDFNLKKSSEPAYQNMINYSNSALRFQDPINKPGNWNNSSSFSYIHSQSTHTSSNGCASTGGMDDRFDIILASASVMNGSNHITYIPNSYITVGNDGNHFNAAINSGSNNSAPASIITDLYNMSDHLPIVLKLKVNQQGAGLASAQNAHNLTVKAINPVSNLLKVFINSSSSTSLKIELFSIIGQQYQNKSLQQSKGNVATSMDISNLPSGLYLLKVTDDNGFSITRKIVKL